MLGNPIENLDNTQLYNYLKLYKIIIMYAYRQEIITYNRSSTFFACVS